MEITDFFEVPYVAGGRTLGGFDCWGLVVQYYKHILGISIPVEDDMVPDPDSKYKSTELLAESFKRTSKDFYEVPYGEEEIGDIVHLKVLGLPIHVGVVVAKNTMIHTTEKTQTAIERYDSRKWKQKIVSFHRHISL